MKSKNNQHKIHHSLVIRETRHPGQYRYRFVKSKNCPIKIGDCAGCEQTSLCTHAGNVACICRHNSPIRPDDIREWPGVLEKFGGKNIIDAIIADIESRQR